MKLITYKLSSVEPDGWDFDKVSFDRVNLLVGDSGTGKTRLVNTIVNFAKQIVSEKIIHTGDWDIEFEVDGNAFSYRLVVKNSQEDIAEKEIVYEELTRSSDKELLVKRDQGTFIWKSSEMPKLAKNISTIVMLREEEEIRDIYSGFRRIVARRFFGDELNQNFQFGALSPDVQKRLIEKHDASLLLNEPIDFHNKMNLLKAIDSKMYSRIVDQYRTAFPYVIDTSIQALSQMFQSVPMPLQAPVFCIREKAIEKWIPVNDISSGMQKLFLLILDLHLMKDSGILLIDEYENSLGINAINFLPDLIYTISEKCQFIITSHHPYIINNIPIENWHVFHRKGLHVSIKSGKELKEKYKASKQEQFIQLINDPFYTSGVE